MCEVVNGGTPKTGISEYWGGENLWITPAEMGKRLNPYVSDTERKITDLGLHSSSAQMLPPNSVILSSRAPIGHLVINTKPMATNQGCKGLIPCSKLQHKYLYYYLSSNVDLLNSLGTGATFKELSGSKLKEVPIPVPPFHDQQRIVSILDDAFIAIAAAKENAERNLQNSRTLYENYLQSIFINRGEEWRIKPLGDLAIFRNGINYTKNSRGECIKIVGVKDFQNNYWTPLENLDIVRIDGNLAEHDVLKKGDILAVRSNGNIELIGRCILAGDIPGKISHSGFTIRIRLSSSEVLPEYLCYFMKSRASRKRLIDNGTGTNIKSLNQTTLSTLEVPYPPISQQRILITKIETLSTKTKKLESIYQKKLADLDELKKSILHKAFNGVLSGAH